MKKFNPEMWFPRVKFSPDRWIKGDTPIKKSKTFSLYNFCSNSRNDVIEIIKRIEDEQCDITRDYFDWVKLGYLFSSEYGELGRDLYQRVSRFHPNYNYHICNRQYDYCLKNNKGSATIKSFFWIARNCGINIRTV